MNESMIADRSSDTEDGKELGIIDVQVSCYLPGSRHTRLRIIDVRREVGTVHGHMIVT